MPLPSRLVTVVVAAALLSGCAHHIRIARTRPAPLNLAADRTLEVLVEAPSTPNDQPTASDAVGAFFDATRGQLIPTAFAVDPLRKEFRDALHASRFPLAAGADTLVRVTPIDWTYRGPLPLQRGTGSGKLQARVEVLDRRLPEAPRLYNETFWATSEAPNEAEAILRAARRLTQAFLRELEPTRVWARVELDDSDPIGKPGIELCERGLFDAAHTAFTDAVSRQPDSAPSLYNLAVLEEARGEYGVAERLLLDATRIQPKTLYFEALERVRRSYAEQAAFAAPQ